jgi:hypothetical protein
MVELAMTLEKAVQTIKLLHQVNLVREMAVKDLEFQLHELTKRVQMLEAGRN